MEMILDFEIPEKYRGKSVNLFPNRIPGVFLDIPSDAVYLDVNPLEDEEEFLGCQDLSDRQEIKYFNLDKKIIGDQSLEGKIITFRLMTKLGEFFIKKY